MSSLEREIQKGKEEVILFLFTDDMILYLKDPKLSQKTLEVINSFGKAARYKINIQKSLVFYTPTMHRLRKKSEKQSHLQ
jgi:hypothetical protein